METVKKIICPLDFSAGSDAALGRAAELARVLGAELELLHVYQVPVLALPDAPITASPSYMAALTSRAQEQLERHRERLAAQGINVSVRLQEGNPAEVIVERAEKKPNSMIVLGTHGRSGFQRLLLGSVTERVVRAAPVPVMVVRLSE